MHDGVIDLGNGNDQKLIQEFRKRTSLRIECTPMNPSIGMAPLRDIETEVSKVAPVEAEDDLVEGPFACALFEILSAPVGDDYISPLQTS